MPTHRDWLAERPFTLALSAGFFGFFAHTGLLLALEEAGILPARVVGISAGALAGGLWASGLDGGTIADELLRLRRADFWDPGLPLGGLLRGDKFATKLHQLLDARGVAAFEACPVPFAAVVHDVLRRRPEAVAHGPLGPAIQASCAVPLMFRPRLRGLSILVDGGVSDRWGLTALRDGERTLLHALPSRSAHSRLLPDQPLPPATEARRTLVIPGLPRVTPFRLDAGAHALGVAREHVRRWLDAPVGA
ncbi:MAG TPA: patatin-like phospholipase family protein [Nannocystaceae bacterium]|nr:patatin-like phospholipase family protein [Nannocystaceae bacterium]